MTILSAAVTEVPIGSVSIEGLLAEDNLFYVGVPQAAVMFESSTNTAARDFKRLMGKDFKTSKLKTEFNKNVTLGIPLKEFERLILELAIKGNKVAQEFSRMLIGLSLEQLFSDAFGLKFEKEERQQYLRHRQFHQKHFHPHLTKWLKHDANGDSKSVYWGKEVNDFKAACNLPLTCIDTWDTELLEILNRAEGSYNSLRLAGLSHEKTMSVIQMQH